MVQSKVFIFFAMVAAVNCYAIANDYARTEDTDAVPSIYETFGDDNGDVEFYRQRRESDSNIEDLFMEGNMDDSYTFDDVDLNDEALRPKRHAQHSVSATAQRNLWNSNHGRSSLDAHAHYSRQFGGGGGRPNYGAGVTFRHKF